VLKYTCFYATVAVHWVGKKISRLLRHAPVLNPVCAEPFIFGTTMRLSTVILFLLFFKVTYPQRFDFTGRILSVKTSRPLSNVSVRLVQANQTIQSDLEGYFVFRGYPTGKYLIELSTVGVGPREFNIVIQQSADTVHIFHFQDTCRYDVRGTSRICPMCRKKNRVVPILYGLPIGELDEANYYYAGCEVSDCDPKWFCKRDSTKF
jgi:hypothetical protein